MEKGRVMKIRLIKKLASNKNQRESRWITDHREKKKKNLEDLSSIDNSIIIVINEIFVSRTLELIGRSEVWARKEGDLTWWMVTVSMFREYKLGWRRIISRWSKGSSNFRLGSLGIWTLSPGSDWMPGMERTGIWSYGVSPLFPRPRKKFRIAAAEYRARFDGWNTNYWELVHLRSRRWKLRKRDKQPTPSMLCQLPLSDFLLRWNEGGKGLPFWWNLCWSRGNNINTIIFPQDCQ